MPILPRFRISKEHIRAILKILLQVALVFLATHWLPSVSIDPWGLLNLKRIGFLFLALVSVEAFSQISRIFVQGRQGYFFVGFLGGLVSSTAVSLSLAQRHAKKRSLDQQMHSLFSLTGALAAMLVEAVVLLWMGSRELLEVVWIQFAGLFLGIGLILTLINQGLNRFRDQASSQGAEGFSEGQLDQVTHPIHLNWWDIVKLWALVIGLIWFVGFGKRQLGDEAVLAISFFGGLFELHGMVLVAAEVFNQAGSALQGPQHQAEWGLALSVLAALLSKLVIFAIWSESGFRAKVTALLGFLLLCGVIAAMPLHWIKSL